MTSSAVKPGLPISDKKKGKGGFDLSKKGTLNAALGLSGQKEEIYPHQMDKVDLSNPSPEVKTREWYEWFCKI